MTKWVAGYKVPIIGKPKPQMPTGKLEALTRHLAVLKPSRVFGAVWTSDKVAQRNSVTMCEICWRRYWKWWKSEEYRPDWDLQYVSDCDGCGTAGARCTLFLPDEKFFQLLTASHHGRSPKPF